MNAFKGNAQLTKAAKRANKAAMLFSKARKKRQQFRRYEVLYQHWKNTLITPEAILLTVIFLISFPVEIMVSYEMYREMLKNYASKPSPILVWMMGFFVVGLAAWVSHLISKKVTSTLFRLEVFTLMHINEGMLEIEAEEVVRKDTRFHFWLGIIFFVVLIGLVAGISWQRSFLTADAIGTADYSLLDKLIPIVVVTIEVFTGIYVAHMIKLWQTLWLKNSSRRSYLKFKEKAAHETQMAYALIHHVQRFNQGIELSKDLRDVLFRVTFLSKSSDEYIDEINIQQCKVIVENHQKLLSNIRVVGLMNFSQLTNAAITNNSGTAFLYWHQNEPLQAIEVDGSIFEGPFYNNSSNRFKIDKNPLLT